MHTRIRSTAAVRSRDRLTHPTTSPHDPTNRLFFEDRIDYPPPVQISRKDGHTTFSGVSVKANFNPEVVRFGLIVGVSGLEQALYQDADETAQDLISKLIRFDLRHFGNESHYTERSLQGYLAHQNPSPPLGPPQGPRY